MHGSQAPPAPETLHTTTEHPFLTTDRGFVNAEDLRIGEQVQQLDGSYGVVVSLQHIFGIAMRYNLTVADDHTYAVGSDQWVVHNTCGDVFQDLAAKGYSLSQHFIDTYTKRAGGISADTIDNILKNGQHFYDTTASNLVAVAKVQGRGLYRVVYDVADLGRLISIAGEKNGARNVIGDTLRYVPPFTVIPGWTNPFSP